MDGLDFRRVRTRRADVYSQPAADETRTAAQRRADALVTIARMAIETHVSEPGRKRRKAKVTATIDDDDLVAASQAGGPDAAESDRGGLDDGRSSRDASDTQFDTLLIRDHGCRWPGCGIPADGCDAHHTTHWLDGGEPVGGGHFNLNTPTGDTTLLRPPLVGLALPTDPPDI